MKLVSRYLPEPLKPYAGRLVLTILGFAVAILFLTIGFWRTILIVLLVAAGFLLGTWQDGALNTASLPLGNRWR